MTSRILTWWRSRLGYLVRHENPRGLSRADYRAALRHRDELLQAEVERQCQPPVLPHEQLRARGEAIRRTMTGAPLTRDQQAAHAHRAAMRAGGW